MSSQCLFCENSLEMYCQECQESYCHHCGIIKHLRNGLIQPHVINYLCEECEEEVSSAYCKSCEQNLCPNCDTKIHNKGKRAQHTREPIANCLCMKDIKIVANLSLNFLKEFCDADDTEKFTEQLDQMSNNIFKGQKDKNDQNIIYISILEEQSEDIPPEDLKALKETLKQVRIKNFLLFENRGSEEDFAAFTQSLAKEPNLNSSLKALQPVLSDACKLYQILKDVKGIESIYLFDAKRNETLASALKLAPNFEDKKFLLNFDPTNPQPFEVSLYAQVKDEKHAEQGSQGGNSFTQKQRVISEPFLPPQILEIQQLNSTEAQEATPAKELDYSDYWGQANTSREEPRKTNQSYDEILLNMSSDQVLQKRSAPLTKAHQQYPYMNQGISQRRPTILSDQPLKNLELAGSLKPSHFLQQELRKFAKKGDLLIMRDDLVNQLTKFIQTMKLNCKVDDLLKQAEEVKIIHTTIRKFLETSPIAYIGMLLDSLTVESLIWIVKSIKNDLMTPTEKLILSRIKECYGLKIEQNLWKSIVNYILANQNQKPNKASSFDQSTMFPLYVNKILDPVTNTDTFVIFLTHDGWTPEDQGIVDENTEEWKEFLTFIGNFFREEENSIDQKSIYSMKPSEADSQDQGKKATWSSSVENVLNRSTNRKDKALKISEDVKAIPGGRYGCAQFIKICGPEVLKKLSIGRLTLFVQEAINKGILRYQRTLLVKNNPNDSISTLTEVEGINNSFTQDPNLERKAKIVKTVKDVLIEILSENPEGIPLAQIPLHLKRKMDYVINFQDLGFPKLKNFLATLPDLVKIESSGTNHAFVKLVNPVSAGARKNLTYKDQIFLPENQDSSAQSFGAGNQNQVFPQNLAGPNMANYEQANLDLIGFKALGSKKYSTLTPSSDKNAKGSRKKVSSLDDYLNKVKGFIELILTDNCYGISMQKLYKELSAKLNCEFDVRLFHCKDFYEFLTNHAENLLDIEIKRNCLIIYPKNFRFGPQTLVNVINIDPQRTSVKASDFSEPISDNKRNFITNQFNPNVSPYQMGKGPMADLEAPPGLVKPMFKPIPATFSAPFSTPVFPSNFAQGQPGLHGNDNRANPNLSHIIPGALYGNANEENDAMSERFLPAPSHSNSYWKGTDISSRSQAVNGGLHSRTDSRILKNPLQEESNLEIRDQLRFIEELLQGDTNEKSMTNFTLDRTTESSFGGFQSPNLSFTAIGQTQTSKMNHSKTQSEDFTNKNILKFPNGGHGRVYSAITERKNE